MDIQEVILKVLNKKDAAAEYEQLKVWKAETEDNLKIYQEINNIVEQGNHLKDYKEYDVESGYARFKNQISDSTNGWIKYAVAGFILCIGAFYLINNSLKTTTEEITPQIYQAENTIKPFDLKDGSTITMNTGAVVTEMTDFTKIRQVALSGEAFFDIQPDKSRPFRVKLDDDLFVEVLGTSFNIINTENEFNITVESGHVELKTLGRTISLYKGDAVKLHEDTLVKYKQKTSNHLSWMKKELTFKNAPITAVLDDVSAHFETSFDVSSKVANSDCNLSSTFNTESLQQIMVELSKMVELSFTKEKDGSYIIEDIRCK